MTEQLRQLTEEETVLRGHLDRWKETHARQCTEGKPAHVLKGSLTRAKNHYQACYDLSLRIINEIADEDTQAAAKSQFEDWEVAELEWQDDKDHHIHSLENPRPQTNAQLSAAARNNRYEILHAKAQSRAENVVRQLKLIQQNMGQSITNRAFETVKSQIVTSEAEIDDTLWSEYEQLLELKPDSRAALTTEYAAHKRELREATAQLLTTSMGLLPSSPVTSTPDTSLLAAGAASGQVSNVSGGNSRPAFSYQRERLPVFSGELRSYPRWSREWKDAQKHYGEDQFFLMLQNATPAWLDVLANSTLDEVWEQLDARFASTRVVAEAALKDYSAFVPTRKSKNERLIEVAEHVNKVYRDLQSVGKGSEIDQTDHLILKVLDWVDPHHRDELIDLFRKDEKAPPQQRVGVFKLIFNYLKENRINLLKYTSLSEPSKTDSEKFCRVCKKVHALPYCRKPPSNVSVNSHDRQPGGRGGRAGGSGGQQPPAENCKFCHKKAHNYVSAKTNKPYVSHRLYDCPEFMKLSETARAQHLEKVGGCSVCTNPDHGEKNCTSSYQKCGVITDGTNKCQARHNRVLHGANSAFIINNLVEVNNISKGPEVNIEPPPVLLFIQKLVLRGKHHISLLYDSGSNTSLITRRLAKLLGLPRRKVSCWVTIATKSPELVETYAYEMTFPIVTENGEWHKRITLYEVPDEITSPPQRVDVSPAYRLFPNVPKGSLERPTERVSILLGMDCADIMPVGGDPQCGGRQGNLVCLKTILGGEGFILGGSHPLITSTDADFEPLVNAYKQARMTEAPGSMTINNLHMMQAYGEELIQDNLGIQPPPQCHDCRSCIKCHKTDVDLSKQDREVLARVQDSLRVEETEAGPQVHMSYPLNSNYDMLINNKYQAIARETSVERQLIRKGRLEEYNQAYQDSIDRGAMVEISEADIDHWLSDPSHRIHFTGHHPVYKDSSKTTPLRIVNDSKMKNGWTGPSANDVMFKGPDKLKNMFHILLRWRQYPVAILWDVSKAYNAVVTSDPENFIRCQVWRFGQTDQPWRIFQYRKMAFGDLIASLGLEIVKDKGCDIAAQRQEVSEAAINKVRDDMFVDDGISGCEDNQEADKLIGEMTILSNGKLAYSGEVSKVLGYVGLKPKVFIRSGIENPKEAMEKQGNVLGHIYDPAKDLISFRFGFKVKFAKGKGEEDLTLDNLNKLVLTRRGVLAAVMQVYDPLGILSPLTIALKIAAKDVTNLNRPWDENLPEMLQQLWQRLLHQLLSCPDVTIPRRVRPVDSQARPELIGMFDGSESAYSSVIYIRYKLIGGQWESRIYAAKARVTPSKGMTVPRSELNSLLITTRLILNICTAMYVKPTRITLMGDSECTISSYEAEHTVLASYFANRVYECEQNLDKVGTKIPDSYTVHKELADEDIKERPQVDALQHVAGILNTADIATRGHATYDDVKADSEWINGPKFLTEDRSKWPISREFIREVPEKEKRSRMFKLINTVKVEAPVPGSLLYIIHSVSSYRVLRGIFARLILAHKTGQPPSKSQILTTEVFTEADKVILWLSMPMSHQLYIEGKLAALSPFWEGGVLYTRGRLGTAGLMYLGPDKLPILHATSRLAVLILKMAHEEDHKLTPAEAVFRSRKIVWIHRAKSTAIMVTKNCAWCRLNKPKFEEQRMADMPKQMFEIPTSPWSNITMDFLASIMCKSMTNKRSQLKCFPLLLCCMNSSAITIRLVPGYDTESLLIQLQAHIAVRGQCKFIYTDSGSQMKAAKEMLEAGLKPVDWSEVRQRTVADGIEWRVAPPESQWRDGRSERMVAAVKASVKHLHQAGNTLNYAELQCLYDRCCDRINDRPLGIHHHNGEMPGYAPITPNMLLKGSRSQLPTVDMTDLSSPNKVYSARLRHMDNLLLAWWKGFEANVFDSLATYPKWREQKDNLIPGDICLLRYDSKFGKPDFRLCEVSAVEKDEKGDVRTVEVIMRPRDSREKPLPYLVKDNKPHRVSVQRLALIYSARYENESTQWPRLQVSNSASRSEKSDNAAKSS